MCDDEATAKEYAIKDPKEAIEEYTSTTIYREASIETKDSKVGDLVTKISDTESELAIAVSMWNKEARDASRRPRNWTQGQARRGRSPEGLRGYHEQ